MSHESVDELLAAGAALNERADRLFERLDRIRATAADRGIEVRVNLEGRPVALTLSAAAMRLPPDELAAEIFRLAQEASAAALAEGLAAIEPVVGEELTAERSDVGAVRPREPTCPPDDFSAIESWALPR
jgi:hypothetical protein